MPSWMAKTPSASGAMRGLSQQETAHIAGISVPYLSQLETGRRKGSLDALSALAKALNMPLDLIAGPPK
jgi:transcriptional regulator with XRE-family HTH domain